MTPSTELLPNFLGGHWQLGTGPGSTLQDPVSGADLVRVDATGLDLATGFAFAREQGAAALRSLSYKQRGVLLGAVVKVLQANRDAYYDIATAAHYRAAVEACGTDGGVDGILVIYSPKPAAYTGANPEEIAQAVIDGSAKLGKPIIACCGA